MYEWDSIVRVMNSISQEPPSVTVMIVDDDPDNLNVLEDALSRAGYRVSVFPCGELALAAAQAEPPDLVLLDIWMPGMDGYEVCRRLKATDVLRPIPILFISALSSAGDIAKGFDCGGVDYIAKPIREPEVLARVRTHLALHGAYAELARQHAQITRAQEELQSANTKLIQMVNSREKELSAAISRALDAADGEARRIGQEIHDGPCQELVGLLRMAEGFGKAESGEPAPGGRAAALAEQTSYILRLTRGISYELTLHDLETQTLGEALAVFGRRFERASGVAIELSCAAGQMAFGQETAGHIYRIVREAVVNAIRHAKARRIWIDLVQERRQTIVSVTNDGDVIDTAAVQPMPGVGLSQILMRARLLGGSFSLKSDARGMTVAELIIPHRETKGDTR